MTRPSIQTQQQGPPTPPPPPLVGGGLLASEPPHQFASSPGDRFWGANELFSFDAGSPPHGVADSPFPPGFEPAGPFDPPPRSAPAIQPGHGAQAPFDAAARAFDPSAGVNDADLSHLLSHLSLPHSADARVGPPPSSGTISDPPLSENRHVSPFYPPQSRNVPPGLPPSLHQGHRGFPPPSHHHSTACTPGLGPTVQPPYHPNYPSGPHPHQTGPGSVPNRLKQDPNEEITTVFLAGFPDDITEREFNNFFVFARGFEAASLKFPSSPPSQNQEEPYLSLGGAAGPMLSASGTGGVPAVAGLGGPGNSRNRMEQIIGFAKFRTRAEAVSARDFLNGRMVDAERGCVLKTEMAKKNLHTKSARPTQSNHNASSISPPSSASPGGPLLGLGGPGHQAHLPSLSHPHSHTHHLSRQAERYQYLAPADLRNPGLGMGPLAALPPPGMPGSLSPGGINSLGEAGSFASGNFGGLGVGMGIGSMSPPPMPLSPGPVSPTGLGSFPLSSSMSLPGSSVSSAHASGPPAHASGPPPIGQASMSSRSTSPSIAGSVTGPKPGPPGLGLTSPPLRSLSAETFDALGSRPGSAAKVANHQWSPERSSPPSVVDPLTPTPARPDQYSPQ